MPLQITSMADIFMILLVFLLKSFSTGVTTLTPPANVELPVAQGSAELTDALKVEITGTAITIEGKLVNELKDFAPAVSELESDGTLRKLNLALRQEREVIKQGAGRDPASHAAERLILVADQDMPYDLLQRVLSSGSNAGFSEFRLLTVEAE